MDGADQRRMWRTLAKVKSLPVGRAQRLLRITWQWRACDRRFTDRFPAISFSGKSRTGQAMSGFGAKNPEAFRT